MNIRQAAQKWVNGFNAFPRDMILKLMKAEPETWHEITVPGMGDRVYIYSESAYGQIYARLEKFRVELDGGKKVLAEKKDVELAYYDVLPAWGTMWSFGESIDNFWMAEQDGIELMSDCGFRIYESDDFGYFFGIDGTGYDFYEQHWIPLYNARGLKWHKL